MANSYHDSDPHVMECWHSMEEEVGSYGHFLSHNHCHYCLHSARCFGQRKELVA